MEVIEYLDGDDIYSAFSLRRFRLSIEICSVLGKALNEVHGVTYSQRFWEILLMQYAGITLSQNKMFNDPNFSYPPSLEEINGLAPPSFKLKLKHDILKVAKRMRALNSFKQTRKLLAAENSLSVGFHPLPEVTEELGKPIPIDNVLFFLSKGDNVARQRADAIAEKQPDVYFKNAIKRLPKIYVEYFQQIIAGIPVVSPEKKVFHVHLPCLYNKFMIALYVEKGAKLYWYQHGAFYGEVEGGGHNLEGRLADEFRSWGWKIGENNRPWKAYRLEYYARLYRAATKEKKYDFVISFPELFTQVEDKYRVWADYFLANISREKYDRFLARPRPLNKIFNHAHYLHFMKHDKRVVVDSGLTKMPEIVAQSRMVIQTMIPGTNFLECIYTNHPTVGILQNDAPTEIVKPYYQFFFDQGVFHNDFESLVRHLNNIDIETWWAGVMQQPVYQEFKERFANQV